MGKIYAAGLLMAVVGISTVFMVPNVALASDKVVVVPLIKAEAVEDDDWTISGTDMYNNNSGNVGIGTTAPDVKLTIQNKHFGQWALNVGGTNNARMKVRHIDGKEPDSIDIGDLYLQYQVNKNTILNAESAGSVGIGTESPASGYKLDVEGKIQATAFDTGDITFRKNGVILWRMFEDENGLYLENVATRKIFQIVLQELGEEDRILSYVKGKNRELEERIVRLESLLTRKE